MDKETCCCEDKLTIKQAIASKIDENDEFLGGVLFFAVIFTAAFCITGYYVLKLLTAS